MAAQRTYLAIDLKSFYASVECVDRHLDPLTTNLVVADASRTEKTICLAVSPSLKAYKIPGRARLFEAVQRVKEVNAQRLQTAIRQKKAVRGEDGKYHFASTSFDANALNADPALGLSYIVAPPRMQRYLDVSTQIYKTYLKYVSPADIYPYSIDEVFIDVTGYLPYYHMSAHELAMTMVREVLYNTGITATAGIGTNLYLAKLAMDIVAKHIPADKDGVRIAELDEQSYRYLLWNHRPLTDFWMTGPGTVKKLEAHGIYTIGDLAQANPKFVQEKLGKVGIMIWQFANGMDTSAVAKYEYKDVVAPIKSIGNSWTTPRDLMTDEDVWIVLYLLSESVAARLRENHFRCRGVEVTLRDSSLFSFERQTKLSQPTMQEKEIAEAAYQLYKKNYRWSEHLRSIGVRAIDLRPDTEPSQLSFDFSAEKQESLEKLESAIDGVRNRFGYYSVQRCVMYKDRFLSHCDAKGDHTIHPHGYLQGSIG